MIPTPDLSHLSRRDLEDVYDPAEDTFLLLDALEQDTEALTDINPRVCLEIGSGSGCVSAFIAKILGASSTLYLCTDINSLAASCTRRTGVQNHVTLDVINAPFANPLLSRLHHSVDVLLFNPPYVPTESDEALNAQDGSIAGAWAGGKDGMEVTNHFLPFVESLLSDLGRFYLVAVASNNVEEIRQRMEREYGLTSEVVLQRHAGREHLHVIRFTRLSVS